MSTATRADPSIVVRMERARRARRRRDRIISVAVWGLILAAVALLLLSTGKIDTEFIKTWAPLIIGGAGTTIVVCVLSIALASMLALVGALARLSANPVIHAVASLYVSLIRGTPLLVQIYVIYFVLPSLGVVLPALWAGVAALGINYGAYLTEIFRAGIQAVPRGQREAAQALGLSERLIMRRVVLPQAIRIVIPAIGNEFIAMIKDSALVSIIGVQETLWFGYTSGRPRGNMLEAIIIVSGVYWALTVLFSYFQARLERRLARGDR